MSTRERKTLEFSGQDMTRAFPDRCVDWPLSKEAGKGYGIIKMGGRFVKTYRLFYEMFVGPIPDGAHVLHSCDNRGCVNPLHLRLGTHAENMNDMKVRGRHGHGARMPQAKLTDELVRQLRSGEKTVREVAAIAGMALGTVYQAKRRETWTHVA